MYIGWFLNIFNFRKSFSTTRVIKSPLGPISPISECFSSISPSVKSLFVMVHEYWNVMIGCKILSFTPPNFSFSLFAWTLIWSSNFCKKSWFTISNATLNFNVNWFIYLKTSTIYLVFDNLVVRWGACLFIHFAKSLISYPLYETENNYVVIGAISSAQSFIFQLHSTNNYITSY